MLVRQWIEWSERLRHGKKLRPGHSHSITVMIPEIDGEKGYEVTYTWSVTAHDSIYLRTVSGDTNPGTNPFVDNVLNLRFDNTKSNRIKIELEVDVDRDEKADISLKTAVNLRNF